MTGEIKKWIEMVHDAWHRLVDDYEELAYGHMREEDTRSYLFCKIRDLLQERGESLLELHADIAMPDKRADIVLGLAKRDSWSLGVEIKHKGQKKPLTDDLNKLSAFIREGKIKSGILAALVDHWDNWEPIFEAWDLATKFQLGPKDKGSSNYWEIRKLKEVRIEDESFKWDSLFFVLRKL